MTAPLSTEAGTPPTEKPAPKPRELPEAFKARIWKPGQSGNPGGRQKTLATVVREFVGNDGRRLVERMYQIWEGELPGFSGRERIEAGKWLSAHGFGTTPTTEQVRTELESSNKRPASQLESADLERMARRLAAPKDENPQND